MAPGTWTPTKRRGPIAAEFQTPGPAAINLSANFGSTPANKLRSPAFTMSARNEAKPLTAGPGPGQYNINGLSYKGKDDPQAPSMHTKLKDSKPFVTPSPGEYFPEKAYSNLEPSHQFSFGVKTNPEKQFQTPAPNSYTVPDLLGSAKSSSHTSPPCFTMAGRFAPPEDKMKVPGPGSYNETIVDNYKTEKSPAFSMGQRTIIPSDHTMKPGPGAHCPEKYSNSNGPKFTLSPRLEEKNKNTVPGPGSYEAIDVNKCKEKLPVYTMAPKTDLPVDKSPKPAPNAYDLEKCMNDTGPKYSISPRLEEINKNTVPGPGSYEAVEVNKLREKQPLYTMSPKTELPEDKSPKPAPNAYNVEEAEVTMKQTPKFSFGIKHSQFLGKLRDQ